MRKNNEKYDLKKKLLTREVQIEVHETLRTTFSKMVLWQRITILTES